MSYYMERQIHPHRGDDLQYMLRLRYELFVMWHRASKNDPDTAQHYMIGRFGEYPRETLRITRVASMRDVEWECRWGMQPIEHDEVAQYAAETQRGNHPWEPSHETHPTEKTDR